MWRSVVVYISDINCGICIYATDHHDGVIIVIISITVKPFNLATQNVGDLACKIILALYFGELKPYNLKYCSNLVIFWPAVDIRTLQFRGFVWLAKFAK